MKSLSILFTTIAINIALLAVSASWLAGQFSLIIGWTAIGGGESSFRIDREGWICQRSVCGWMRMWGSGRSAGITSLKYDPVNSHGLAWSNALADGDIERPFPGVVRYRSPINGLAFVNLIAFKHWLLFATTFGVWCGWRFSLRRWFRPKAAHTL
jgi:hypothetical protein